MAGHLLPPDARDYAHRASTGVPLSSGFVLTNMWARRASECALPRASSLLPIGYPAPIASGFREPVTRR